LPWACVEASRDKASCQRTAESSSWRSCPGLIGWPPALCGSESPHFPYRRNPPLQPIS
jgi:hypothetical protein